jgi:hypothetical protein
MSCLPGEQSIKFSCDLPNEDVFKVTTGGRWQVKLVDLSEHALNPHHAWLKLFGRINVHDAPP